MVYVVTFSTGFGPIPWLMMGEIFPGRIRGAAASIATAFNWTCTFIVTKSFMDLQVSPYRRDSIIHLERPCQLHHVRFIKNYGDSALKMK